MSDLENMEMGEVQAKADQARATLSNPIFQEAFEMLNQGIVDQLLATPAEASVERERLFSMFKAGQMFVNQFASLINNLELRSQPEGD